MDSHSQYQSPSTSTHIYSLFFLRTVIGSFGQKAPIEIKMDFKELLDLAAQSFTPYQLTYIADLDSAA